MNQDTDILPEILHNNYNYYVDVRTVSIAIIYCNVVLLLYYCFVLF